MNCVITLGTFSLKKYLQFMGWRKVPKNHWSSTLDGEIAILHGDKWKCDGYSIDERWLA